MKLLYTILIAALQFTSVDNDFKHGNDYNKCLESLQQMYSDAQPGKEKAEVLWRMSRVYLVLGEEEADVSRKRALYNKGIEQALSGIKEDPSNQNCYMWHCANIGRNCQTESLMEQASAVPQMTEDLTMILDNLGESDCSEAWQALSEIYWNHPFKSDNAAINFARKAAVSIPSDELRISTYSYLAELLYKRNWSRSKRTSEARSNSSSFKKKYDSVITRYSYYDGADEIMPWCSSALSSMSDKEEGDAIIAFAKSRYENQGNRTHIDEEDYKKLLKMIKFK